MIMKLKNGAELWLAGIPTERGRDRFPLAHLQVVCFPESPTSRGGIELYGAQVRHLCVAHADRRNEDWQKVWPLIRNTLFQGQLVLLHCTAGRHRAAVVAVIIVAIMCRISVTEAHQMVLKRRPIQLEQAFQDEELAKWAYQMVRVTKLANPWPKAQGWICTERSHCHIMTYEGVALCAHKQGSTQAARLQKPLMTSDPREAEAWCKTFCRECAERAPAGFLL